MKNDAVGLAGTARAGAGAPGRAKARRPGGRGAPETVCFRLPDNYMQDLLTRAAGARVGHNEFARGQLLDYLEDGTRDRLEHTLSRLLGEVALLRGDLATLAEALLVLAGGGSVSPDEAREWVEERLRLAARGEG